MAPKGANTQFCAFLFLIGPVPAVKNSGMTESPCSYFRACPECWEFSQGLVSEVILKSNCTGWPESLIEPFVPVLMADKERGEEESRYHHPHHHRPHS